MAPVALDEFTKASEFSNTEQQMGAAQANAVKPLSQFGATLDNVVKETLYVLDVYAAFAALVRSGKSLRHRAAAMRERRHATGVSRAAH